MSADYEKIRDENIARYGWDTAVLDLLGQLYSERTHFLLELIQNAEDAGATEVAFDLFDDRLELRHDGRPFTEADVRGLCGVAKSGKSLTAIGQFGIGFKSVYAYTKTPRVYSGHEHFGIERYVRPFAVEPLSVAGTLFVFPFDLDTVPPAVALPEISAALNALAPRILLFLEHIGRLRVGGTGVASSVISRATDRLSSSPRHVALSADRGRRGEEWLVWERPVAGLGQGPQRVEVAFRLDPATGRIVGSEPSPLAVFFPTEKETFLGFVIQGPYRTTPARDNVPEHDPSNQALVRETAALLADVLVELRVSGLLTVDVLEALPIDPARFPPGSMFRPLFDAVRSAMVGQELIPAAPFAAGGYRSAEGLRLASDPGLPGLLDPERLGLLFGAGRDLFFASELITPAGTPVLWRYLREEIGIGEVTPFALVASLSREFLEDEPDEWITRLYAFLFDRPALWRAAPSSDEEPGPARTTPVIRLEDGRHVEPFDQRGRPMVYLPGPGASGFPTVRRDIADSPAARPFLDALHLPEPDLVAEILELILPRYDGLDVSQLDLAQHAADLDGIMRALDEAPPGPLQELLERLQRTAFLIGENAATGEQRLMPPVALYQRSKDLEVYFEANPDAWFAGDGYGPWLVQLRAMGVRQAVEVRARTPDPLGHVLIVASFGRNERGLDGFDPEAEIDGLDFALRHAGHARSEYVWNVLLAPNRRLVAGAVERAVLPSFGDSQVETVRSAIALTAESTAWLPGRDGSFHLPAELSLDDLPPTYARDEGLAQALGMLQPVVSEAARRLGLPVDVLWGLSAHPDLVAIIERELADRAANAPELSSTDRPNGQAAVFLRPPAQRYAASRRRDGLSQWPATRGRPDQATHPARSSPWLSPAQKVAVVLADRGKPGPGPRAHHHGDPGACGRRNGRHDYRDDRRAQLAQGKLHLVVVRRWRRLTRVAAHPEYHLHYGVCLVINYRGPHSPRVLCQPERVAPGLPVPSRHLARRISLRFWGDRKGGRDVSWPLKSVDVITLFVEDLERAKVFYRDVFGLPVAYEDANSAFFRFHNMGVNLLATSAAPELVEPAVVASREAGSRLVLTVGVDDVDAVCAELATAGVALLNGPVNRPWGIRTASFSDPGGHIWEIAQDLPPTGSS
ncbi:MAG TPA: VOC family protein [Streptosporangiaceae bacterium]|nr:VOC family protein [Streptosporangiaceae bacterium]